MSNTPISESEVKQFIREWFRKINQHPPADEMLPFVAGECKINTPAKKDEPFKDWYDGAAKYRDQIHTIKALVITTSPDTATAKVKVIVRWERSDSNSPSPESRLASYAAQTWTLERSPQPPGLRILVYNVEYFLDEVHPLAEEKLLEFKLCSQNGEKMRDEEIIYDTEEKVIPDEKWLTLTRKVRDLQDLKILAGKLLADNDHWQNIFKRNTIYALVKMYKEHNKAEIDGVSLRKILERERDNAQWDNVMALFSSIAYLDKEQIRDFLKAFGIKEDNDILIIDDEDTDTQGFFFRFKTNEEKSITIHAWRGTDSSRDWWRTNFRTGLLRLAIWKLNPWTRTSNNPIFTHWGIKRAMEASLNNILSFLSKESDTINILTGHSLGGGLANAFVPVLVENNKKVVRLTTFGAERSLSRRGLTQLGKKITAGAVRWISHSDPVPYLPPWLDVIGTVFYFNNNDGPAHITNEPPFLRERTLMWIKSLCSKEDMASHHDLDCYLFKTRHLVAYLTHILEGGKEEEYDYRYPHSK